ncbi:Fungal specific transcription factor domain-containing protein [Cladophialophora immunda]|nr:Fungal specific transcription factor domain-containing protein [Cladophialophora immunda]
MSAPTEHETQGMHQMSSMESEIFKRTPKALSVQRMSAEIERLRKELEEAQSTAAIPAITPAESRNGALVSLDWTSLFPGAQDESAESAPAVQPSQPIYLHTAESPSTEYRSVGNVSLTRAQVNEHFKIYFARCHPYLPFKMTVRTPEAVWQKSPLLFWVICSAAARWKVRLELMAPVRSMLADTIHSSPRSIEKVQALLIMAMWPFSIKAIMEDPTDYYCSLATQMALQLGLHRPNQTHLHDHGSDERANARMVDEEVKTTTWLACFIMNHRQSLCRGVPQSIRVDFHLLKAFENKAIEPRLSGLCRVYNLAMQANLAIGADAPTTSGMLEPEKRLEAVNLWTERFASLQTELFRDRIDDVVRTSFLYLKLQVLSFALLDDMPVSPGILDCVEVAKQDAYELVDLCGSQNLSLTPASVRYAICFAGFVFVKILRSSYNSAVEVLQDNIERVLEALTTTTSSAEDTFRKACITIQSLMSIEDRKLSSPICTRLGASMVYDLLRICAEHKYGPIIDEQRLDLDFFEWNL